MRWPTQEDVSYWLSVLLFLLAVFWIVAAVTGCTSRKGLMQVKYKKSCEIEVQVAEVVTGDSWQDVDFDDCSVGGESDNTAPEKPSKPN